MCVLRKGSDGCHVGAEEDIEYNHVISSMINVYIDMVRNCIDKDLNSYRPDRLSWPIA